MACQLPYNSSHIYYQITSLVLYNLFSVPILLLVTGLPTLSLMALNVYGVPDLSENPMKIMELLF